MPQKLGYLYFLKKEDAELTLCLGLLKNQGLNF